ncbi:hypothetical protein DMC47_44465, partial [Nostoc sp. 3335mG]
AFGSTGAGGERIGRFAVALAAGRKSSSAKVIGASQRNWPRLAQDGTLAKPGMASAQIGC